MLLTISLAIVFCAAITLMLLAAVAFIQNTKFFLQHQKKHRRFLFREIRSCSMEPEPLAGLSWYLAFL